jgi:AcrR family transcriptional regulator
VARVEKTYHHGNLRQALIDAGLASLQIHGGGEVSLRELARACGVSPNAPYRHFKSREALLAALAEHGFQLLAGKLAETRSDGPVKQFRELSQTFADFGTGQPALFKLMFTSGTPMQPEMGQPSRIRCFDQVVESVRIVMGEVMTTEEVKQHAVAAWSLLCGYTLLAIENTYPFTANSQPMSAKDAARVLARGLKK